MGSHSGRMFNLCWVMTGVKERARYQWRDEGICQYFGCSIDAAAFNRYVHIGIGCSWLLNRRAAANAFCRLPLPKL